MGDSGDTFTGARQQASGDAGRISSLYTFGAPGGGSPGLVNPVGNGCWPGLRVVVARKEGLIIPQQTDPVPLITEPFGYEHQRTASAKIFTNATNSSDFESAGCGEALPDHDGEIIEPFLHTMGNYLDTGAKYNLGALTRKVLDIGLNVSTMRARDQKDVANTIKPFGWNLIDSAEVDNSFDWVHDSVTHLLQEPNTKSCMLTFRGSRSINDWINNVQIVKAHFCGLVEEDESCWGLTGKCEPRGERSSFVHKGFRDHFMALVTSEDYVEKIAPHLSGCSEVIALGHSLGGTSASFFGTCAAKALKPGDYGYEDYKYVGWTVGTPRKLPCAWKLFGWC